MIEDAGVLIEEQRVRSQQATASRSAGDYPYTGFIKLFRIFVFTDAHLEYLNWEGLEEWLEYIAETFPDNTEVLILSSSTIIPPSGRVLKILSSSNKLVPLKTAGEFLVFIWVTKIMILPKRKFLWVRLSQFLFIYMRICINCYKNVVSMLVNGFLQHHAVI